MKSPYSQGAIAPQPDWVKREIGWLLEMGTLSANDENFLRRIARKKVLGELTDKEIIRLTQIQGRVGA